MIKVEFKYQNKKYISNVNENDFFTLTYETKHNENKITIIPKKEIELIRATIANPFIYKKDQKIFANGYQSWTDTKEFDYGKDLNDPKRLPKNLLKKYGFLSYGDYYFYNYTKGEIHGYTYSYIRNKDDTAYLIGSLNDNNAILIIVNDQNNNQIRLISDCEHKLLTKPFVLYDYIEDEGNVFEIQEKYFSYFGNNSAPKIRGYTSWYNDYQNINEEKMYKALEGIDNKNYDLFQIDDGYETFVGDWLDVDSIKFPNGLKPIVDKIHSKGLKAGIWLAPFVVEKKSKFFAEHRNLLQSKNSSPVSAGSNWSNSYPLDLSKNECKEYIKKFLQYYVDLGFDFFKLDFLYAAILEDTKEGKTRGERMSEAMDLIRSVLKDKLILGCGVPLSNAFNKVDYCRIGPDVSLIFDDVPYMRICHRERISTKNTIQNTIFRYFMNGHVFNNDPDVYILRDDNIRLTAKQKEALITINSLFGSVYMSSDNVAEYDDKKKELLNRCTKLYNAKVTYYKIKNAKIYITYELDNKIHKLVYNWRRGIIS